MNGGSVSGVAFGFIPLKVKVAYVSLASLGVATFQPSINITSELMYLVHVMVFASNLLSAMSFNR